MLSALSAQSRYRRDYHCMGLAEWPDSRKAAAHHSTGWWAHWDRLTRDYCAGLPQRPASPYVRRSSWSAGAHPMSTMRAHISRISESMALDACSARGSTMQVRTTAEGERRDQCTWPCWDGSARCGGPTGRRWERLQRLFALSGHRVAADSPEEISGPPQRLLHAMKVQIHRIALRALLEASIGRGDHFHLGTISSP